MLSALPAAPCPSRIIRSPSSWRGNARCPPRQADPEERQLVDGVVPLEGELGKAGAVPVDQPQLHLAAGGTKEGQAAVEAGRGRVVVARQAPLEGGEDAGLTLDRLGRGAPEQPLSTGA